MQSKKIAYCSLFITLAILMSYVEMLIPLPMLVPGMKLGLANAIVILVLYSIDAKTALFISFVRVLLSGLLFQGFSGVLYSLAGAVFSFTMMYLAKKSNFFSIVGVSILGGIFHNVGQILIAAAVVENLRLLYYFPVLLITGIVTGTLIGIISKTALVYLQRNLH